MVNNNVDKAAMITGKPVSKQCASDGKELTWVCCNPHNASTSEVVVVSALRTSVECAPGTRGVPPPLQALHMNVLQAHRTK